MDMPAPAVQSDTSQQDHSLEYDSIAFLSQLEQLAKHFQDKSVQTSPKLILGYLSQITNHVAAFAVKLPLPLASKFTLDMMLTKGEQHFVYLRPQHAPKNILRDEVIGDIDAPQAWKLSPPVFHRLCQDMLRLIKLYLLYNVRAFQSPALREQWKRMYGSFFLNLSRTIHAIQGQHPKS